MGRSYDALKENRMNDCEIVYAHGFDLPLAIRCRVNYSVRDLTTIIMLYYIYKFFFFFPISKLLFFKRYSVRTYRLKPRFRYYFTYLYIMFVTGLKPFENTSELNFSFIIYNVLTSCILLLGIHCNTDNVLIR